MEVKDIIKSRRIDMGLTMKELADRIGVSEGTVSRWESGNIANMRRDKISALSRAIEIPIDVLMGWDNDAGRFEAYASAFNQHHASNEYGKSVAIPILRRVAAGVPLTSYDEIIGYEAIPESLASRGTYFALKIFGDSMSPGICDGDIVICREQPEAEEGQIVVAIVNGDDGVCKRFRRYDNNTIALMSDNPAYQPMYFSATEIDSIPVQIKGVVVELRRKF